LLKNFPCAAWLVAGLAQGRIAKRAKGRAQQSLNPNRKIIFLALLYSDLLS